MCDYLHFYMYYGEIVYLIWNAIFYLELWADNKHMDKDTRTHPQEECLVPYGPVADYEVV